MLRLVRMAVVVPMVVLLVMVVPAAMLVAVRMVMVGMVVVFVGAHLGLIRSVQGYLTTCSYYRVKSLYFPRSEPWSAHENR